MGRRLMFHRAHRSNGPKINEKSGLIKTVTPQTFTVTDVQLNNINSQKATQTSLKQQCIIHELPKLKSQR